MEVRVQGLGLGVYNLEFMVSGFRVRGLGFMMEYLQLRVTGGGLCVAGGARLWDTHFASTPRDREAVPRGLSVVMVRVLQAGMHTG